MASESISVRAARTLVRLVRLVRPAAWWLMPAAVVWVGACLNEPLAPSSSPPRAATVSNPGPALAAAQSSGSDSISGLSDPDVVYVSLQPGTIPTGGIATIRNQRTGSSIVVAMAQGGFDPVSIVAGAGDTLNIEVLKEGGGESVLLLTVPTAAPLIVVRTNPPRRKRDVPLNPRIVIVFSEPIRPSSAGSIRLLLAGTAVSGDLTVTADGLRAEFTPSGLLAPNTDYVLLVPTEVADLGGETLERAEAVEFATGSVVATASVFTEEAALVTNPSTGALRAFDMAAAMDESGQVTGFFSIFYPELGGARTTGRVTCFTIVDGSLAWVAGVAEQSWNPANVGIEYAWRVVDNGPLGGLVPDQLSLAQLLDPAIPGSTAQAWCATTPLKPPGYNGDLVPFNLLGGGIVVTGATGATPPPPPPAAGLSQIAYFAGPGGILIMPADGSTGWPLTNVRNDANPAWSPDGTRLAFQSDRAEQGNWDLWVINWDRSGLTRLTSGPERDQDPVWSPQGTMLAFLRNGSIHVMNADGSGVTRVSDAGNDSHPSWSPDGTRIVFASTRSGAHAIHVMNADGSGVVQLTSDSASDYSPTWSPDGARIAFARKTQQANEGAYIMNADGSGMRRLTLGINGHASWSRDGTKLAYELFGINVINADGTGITRIGGSGFNPVWSPVGAMPSAPVPFRSVQLAGGDGQSAALGTTLAQPLSVRVVRDDGTPETGVSIRWNVWTGGQPVPPTLAGAIGSTTDASGIASVQLTMGGALGPVRVRAVLADGTARAGEVVFVATATAGPPVSLCCGSGGGYGLSLSSSSAMHSVGVQDGQGNSVSGIPIRWAVTAGDGTITALPDTIVGTDPPQSLARARHSIGPNEGTAEVTATAPTIAGAPTMVFRTTVVTAIVAYLSRGEWINGDSVTVPAGRTVAWVWHTGGDSDDDQHNITFEDDPTEPTSSPTVQYGNFTRKFSGAPRTIRYRCTLHSTGFADPLGEMAKVIVR